MSRYKKDILISSVIEIILAITIIITSAVFRYNVVSNDYDDIAKYYSNYQFDN